MFAILLCIAGLGFLTYAYLSERMENDELKKRLDIQTMELENAEIKLDRFYENKRNLVGKINELELPFFAKDNTNLKTGYDVAKSDIVKLIEEEE